MFDRASWAGIPLVLFIDQDSSRLHLEHEQWRFECLRVCRAHQRSWRSKSLSCLAEKTVNGARQSWCSDCMGWRSIPLLNLLAGIGNKGGRVLRRKSATQIIWKEYWRTSISSVAESVIKKLMIGTDTGWVEKGSNFWGHIKGQRFLWESQMSIVCCYKDSGAPVCELARDCSATAERTECRHLYCKFSDMWLAQAVYVDGRGGGNTFWGL